MKPLNQLALLFITTVVCMACQTGTGKKQNETEKPVMVSGKRCSFDLPATLFMVPIDTSKFSPDGYYKIHSHKTNNTLQIFIFDSKVDPYDKVSNQVSHINAPEVFTAQKTDSLDRFGKYPGTGVIMTGFYQGGVVHGNIRIFSANSAERGFLIIRQLVAGNDQDDAAFETLEKSFLLK
jgi:hypothetical protein